MLPVTLDESVSRVLRRMGDLEEKVWSRDEVAIYLQDGYDRFCRDTKCLFDFHYVENLPVVGSHSSDEEFELAKEIPGLVLAGIRHYTGPNDFEFAPVGSVGPAMASTHADIEFLEPLGILGHSPTGQLPRGYVEIERVMYNREILNPEFGATLGRYVDNRYTEMGGQPFFYTVDSDGLFSMRLYPYGEVLAAYDSPDGLYGVETYDPDYTGDIEGDWGSMTEDPEHFPIGGPWGSPTRTHPDEYNTRVEITRLGRPLTEYPYEVPATYVKYIEMWARYRMLKRDGDGQDLRLSEHFKDRFNEGVRRAMNRKFHLLRERVGRIGHGPHRAPTNGLVINLPYNYGKPRRRR